MRVATHKLMSQRVQNWRNEHEDWKALAAFILSKNTGRRFKVKKTPLPPPIKAVYSEKDFSEGDQDSIQHRLKGLAYAENVEEEQKSGDEDRVGFSAEDTNSSDGEDERKGLDSCSVKKKNNAKPGKLSQTLEKQNKEKYGSVPQPNVKQRTGNQALVSDDEEDKTGEKDVDSDGGGNNGSGGDSEEEEEEESGGESSEEEEEESSEGEASEGDMMEEAGDIWELSGSEQKEDTQTTENSEGAKQKDSKKVSKLKPSVPLRELFSETVSKKTNLKPRVSRNKEMVVKKINLDNIDEELNTKNEDLSFMLESKEPAPKRMKKDAFFLGDDSDEEAESSASAAEEDGEDEEDVEEDNKERAINSMTSTFIGTLSDRHQKKR